MGQSAWEFLRKASIFCVLTGLLFGCATYQPKPILPQETAALFEARTLDSPELKEFLEKNLGGKTTPWPLKTWDFRMLTLAAFYYHPDLDVARARWGVAEAAKITAGQRPNPTFGFTPQYNANSASGISPWTLTFNFDIPIETAGKRGYRLAQAQHLSEAARLNIAVAAWGVRSRLAARFFELYAAQRTRFLLQRQEALQEEVVKLMEARLTSGEVSLPDVTQGRVALVQTRLLLLETQKQQAQAFAALASALGVPEAALMGIDLSFSSVEKVQPTPSEGDIRRRALTNRADILAALAGYEAAQAALQLEIAKQYPDLHLGPGYSWDQDANKWFFGFSASLPLFNRNQGPIAEAETGRKEAAARFNALQAHVVGEVEQSLSGYRAAIEKLKAADSLLSLQQSRQTTAEALFQAGEADRLALASARLELQTAVLARLDALFRVQQARAALEDALQQPLTPGESSLAVNVEKDPRPEKERTQ